MISNYIYLVGSRDEVTIKNARVCECSQELSTEKRGMNWDILLRMLIILGLFYRKSWCCCHYDTAVLAQGYRIIRLSHTWRLFSFHTWRHPLLLLWILHASFVPFSDPTNWAIVHQLLINKILTHSHEIVWSDLQNIQSPLSFFVLFFIFNLFQFLQLGYLPRLSMVQTHKNRIQK